MHLSLSVFCCSPEKRDASLCNLPKTSQMSPSCSYFSAITTLTDQTQAQAQAQKARRHRLTDRGFESLTSHNLSR